MHNKIWIATYSDHTFPFASFIFKYCDEMMLHAARNCFQLNRDDASTTHEHFQSLLKLVGNCTSPLSPSICTDSFMLQQCH